MLQLERRPQDRASDFNALFLLPSPEAVVSGNDGNPLFIRQDIRIVISSGVEEKNHEHPQPNQIGPTESQNYHQSSLEALSFGLDSASSQTHSDKVQKHGWNKLIDKARGVEKKLWNRGKKDKTTETANQNGDVLIVTRHKKGKPVGGVQHQSHLAAAGAATSTAEGSQETVAERNVSATREGLGTEALPSDDI
jgi:hypothetical protein